MIERILTVGGYTLVSRVTGFARDIMLAAILGAGPVADAFFVAFRLPNHFRAIFAEGAFNAAFIPAYARIRTQGGAEAAKLFGDRIFTLLLATQLLLLALALVFTPQAIDVLAPGFSREPQQFALAVSLTRITFPYLLLITLVTLWGGILNALQRFAVAAAAPILLNLSMMATLTLAPFFGGAGRAAAWGVLISGVLQAALVGGDTWRAGVMTSFHALRWDDDVRRFFKALVPATIGSAGTQLALFADTIIASFLSAGALSALYYADRIDQLPIGVIGIAVGTVLVPEMTSRVAAGDDAGARAAQNRAIEFALLLAIPCVVAFLVLPDLIMRGLFMRGRFTADDAHAAAMTLVAYTIGLIPFVLVRSVVAPFLARGDTATPVKAALTGTAVNVVFKIALMGSMAQIGLALATSIGAWINFVLVLWFARRDGFIRADATLRASLGKLAIAGGAFAVFLLVAAAVVTRLFPSWPSFRDSSELVVLAVLGGLFMRGRFTADDAHAAAMTLVAYTIGLIPFVLVRSVVAPFLARGDTATPVKAALTGTAVNVVFKIVLMGSMAQIGLALATSIGAWINFVLVLWFARRDGFIRADATLRASLGKLAIAGGAFAIFLLVAAPLVTRLLPSWPSFRDSAELVVLAVLGGVFYGALVAVLFGRQLLSRLRARSRKAAAVRRDAFEGTSAPAAEPDHS